VKHVTRRRAIALVAGSVVLLLSGACSIGGDDDETPTATTAAVAGSPTTSQAAASPTTAASPSVSASPTTQGSPGAGSPTSQGSPVASGSPTAGGSPPAGATPTRAAAATATVAPSPTPTAAPEAPVGEIVVLDPAAIPNYTLTIDIAATGIGGPGDSTFVYTIEQSATDRYHLKADSSGTSLEIWKVGDSAFIAQEGGEPAPLPEGSDTALFSPATFLQVVPPIASGANAQDLGVEEIDGRSARHYRLSGESFLGNVPFLGGQEVTDVGGEIDVWVDEELKTPLRQQGEVTWVNADDSEGKFSIDYQLTQVGSTAEVQPPATP